MAKLPVILGNLDVTIDNVAPDVTSKPVGPANPPAHVKSSPFY